MKQFSKVIVILSVYAISFFGSYRYAQIIFSKGGRLEGQDPGLGIAFLTICPVFNTVNNIMWIIMPPQKESDYSNFFKLTK